MREAIAREKLAVAGPDAVVVLGEPEWEYLVAANEVVAGGAHEAAEAFVGRPIARKVDVRVPGRLEWRGPEELWDGAHNPSGAEWLVEHVPPRAWTLVVSILGDKDAGGMLRILRRAGETLVATRSSNPRALPADELATLARPLFGHVEHAGDPAAARDLALSLGRPVLVTGSLYLLADLAACLRSPRCGNPVRA
jgi:dihydrofolate synthase/folylpolyglutamate synthase